MRETLARLTGAEHGLDPDTINIRFLAYTCVVCKNRVEESTKKYIKFLEATKPCGLTHVETEDEMWADEETVEFFKRAYQPTGPGQNGGRVMWISAADTQPSDLAYVRSGILYAMAIHADPVTIRQGVTFCVDVTKSKVINEDQAQSKRLQTVNQSYPTRPQVIMIAGASTPVRIVINGLIKVASVFTKQKILDRITFVSIQEAVEMLPPGSAPVDAGGEGGGIDDLEIWAKQRLAAFPTPNLDPDAEDEFEA